MNADEVRNFLIEKTEQRGGHIGANLSTVELTLALNEVFDFKKDWIIFDTGHQGYTYKILTGRKDSFDTLNEDGGMSRFLSMNESEFDRIEASHAGTAISIATGVAQMSKDSYTIAFVGDGTLVEGMTWEGLNFASQCSKLIIVLNDNEIAIDKNVGSINDMFTSPDWEAKSRNFFTALGFQYIAVKDGHSIPNLVSAMETAKSLNSPTVIHAKTIKGKGLEIADKHPYRLHFSQPYNRKDISSTSPVPKGTSFAKCVAEAIKEYEADISEPGDNFYITAATPYASSLDGFKELCGNRYIDVGMAEQQLLGIAAGIALKGGRPNVFVQSTFLQRSIDQVIHDLAYMKLPVNIFAVRSGFAGQDSPTHHAIFDLSIYPSIPNVQVLFPATTRRAELITRESISPNRNYDNTRIILLPYYPVDKAVESQLSLYDDLGFGIYCGTEKTNKLVISFANSNNYVLEYLKGIRNCNHLILETLDFSNGLIDFANSFSEVIVIEENITRSGFASQLSLKGDINVRSFGTDHFPAAGTQNHTLESAGMSLAEFTKFN